MSPATDPRAHDGRASPGTGPSSAPLTLPETATLVAGHVAVEEALFELTGAWSVDPGTPAVASFFASQSAFHAWRAAEWSARLPRSVQSGSTAPPEAWGAALEAVRATTGDAAPDGLDDDDLPLARLATWTVALQPGLLARYRRHRGVLAAAADGGLDRWLGLALADAGEGWSAGNELLHRITAEGSAGAAQGGVAVDRGARVLSILLGGSG